MHGPCCKVVRYMNRRFVPISFVLLLMMGCGGGSEDESIVTSPTKPTEVPHIPDAPDVPTTETPEQESAVEIALRTGNALVVEKPNDFIVASRDYVTEWQTKYDEIKRTLASNNTRSQLAGLTWEVSHDAAILKHQFGFNDTVLKTNKALVSGYKDQALTLGLAGQKRAARYLFLGANPMRSWYRESSTVNAQMHQWLSSAIKWLTVNSKSDTHRVVIAQMDESRYFPDESATRAWLDQQFGSAVEYNTPGSCDDTALRSCLSSNIDLLILSQHMQPTTSLDETIRDINAANIAGIPVLYMHLDGNMTPLGDAIFDYFNVQYVGDNYWRRLGVVDWNPLELEGVLDSDIVEQQALLSRLENESFSVNMAECDDKSCPNTSGMKEQFYTPIASIRGRLRQLDESNVSLFSTKDYRYEKLMLLLADKYRQQATFPMDKQTTPTSEFLRSYYADHIQYHVRDVNPKQPDMGNFSRSEFIGVPRETKVVNLESKSYFRSAGVYAFPGETIQVTRLDNSPVKTSIAFNTLRSGATHEFDPNGYNRPKHVTSGQFEVTPGETIRLTSAYGGPVQIHFDVNDLPVSFRFENVGLHPVWRSAADNESFIQQLEANMFDWAELVTSGFEVHSKQDKMKQSMQATEWATPADMALATQRYVSNLPHALSGFTGPGIDEIEEIHGFSRDQSWDIATIDIVKHMNADQPNCGSGCSGNPYDAGWAFNPVGHGDLHELGHGLERSRFRFEGWEGHTSTNFYSYYSKSMFYRETGNDPTCQSLDFKAMYELLQTSRSEPDPAEYMRQLNNNGWTWGARLYIQMMMSAQGEGILSNGWHLLGRLHILERNFNQADNSESNWDLAKGQLGFSQYNFSELNSLSQNDWLLISLSRVLEKDMTNYLTMYGFVFSDKAKGQVAANGYSAMPLNFYVSSNIGYCKTEFASSRVPIDGSTSWPL